MHNENKPLLALMFLSTMKEMLVTGNAQKPHLVNLILMRRNILARGGTFLQEEEKESIWERGRN